MIAEITYKTDKSVKINWSDEELGFGELVMVYTDNGNYELHAEYLGIDTVIEIFKSIKNKK